LIIEGDRQHGASQVDVNRQHLLGFKLFNLAAKTAGFQADAQRTRSPATRRIAEDIPAMPHEFSTPQGLPYPKRLKKLAELAKNHP
jgi:hypothetical protein